MVVLVCTYVVCSLHLEWGLVFIAHSVQCTVGLSFPLLLYVNGCVALDGTVENDTV
jgi:hypothetical protein